MSDDVSAEIRSVLTDVLDKGPEELEASWRACAEAGLLGLAAPEAYDGEGLGLGELAVLVREAATRARDLPFVETLVCGLLPLARYGSDDLQQSLVPRIVGGAAPGTGDQRGRRTTARVTVRPPRGRPPDRHQGRRPLLTSSPAPRSCWSCWPAVRTARWPSSSTLLPTASSAPRRASRGLAEATYTFARTPVVGVLDHAAGEMLRSHAVAGLLLRGAGLLAGARDLTADYVRERTQFGRSLAEFQGVAMQVADVYVTSRLVDLAAEEVARRVGAGEPSDGRRRRRDVLVLRAPRPRRSRPATTCTAGWASTRPTRCTASSHGPRTRPGCWAGRSGAVRRTRRGGVVGPQPRAHRRAARVQGRGAHLLLRPGLTR